MDKEDGGNTLRITIALNSHIIIILLNSIINNWIMKGGGNTLAILITMITFLIIVLIANFIIISSLSTLLFLMIITLFLLMITINATIIRGRLIQSVEGSLTSDF